MVGDRADAMLEGMHEARHEGLDGYLTALIIGPRFVDPRQWIPDLTGPEALNLPAETTEHRAVQAIVAEYNRISASLAETPKDHRPGSPGSMI
jgi:uncharacterized protein